MSSRGNGVAVVVQARMSSARLPGKVLRPLAGEPSIVRLMERVARARCADARLVATSTDPSDDRVAEVCARRGVDCIRGPLGDVLGRYLVAMPAGCGILVRITGDCPLVEPALIDRHVERFRREQPWAEYVTNAVVRTMPDGLDVEVVSRALLEEAGRRATDPFDREHVTPWVRRHARTIPVAQEVDLSSLRFTLDTAEDYRVIAAIYEELHAANPAFGAGDVYRLLTRRPDLIQVAGPAALSADERSAWVARIEAHLSVSHEVTT